MAAVAERVERAVAPLIADAGLDLEGVDVQPAGRRRVVRILVDRDGGVSLDDIAGLSKQLSQALDAADAMGDQPYVLEVTSPGVDRPLTQPRHWRRNIGRLVTVTTSDGHQVSGRILAADESAATVDTGPGGSGPPTVLPYATVTRAQVEVEFNRPGKG